MASYTTSDLVDLVLTGTNATIFPSDDAIISVIQARLRAELPYTYLGSSTLLVANPLRTLANLNDANTEQYIKQYFPDSSQTASGTDLGSHLPPHPYDLAVRAYHAMRRTNASQAIVFSGATNAGKSYASKLITSQLIRMSSHASNRESRLANQVHALKCVFDSFASAKTSSNGNASRAGRYLEMHFNQQGRLGAVKMLTFGLDKMRACAPLQRDERTFHVFYQLLAGATSEERDMLRLEDLTSYTLLSSSGCYRVSGGPASDDSLAMEELRNALKTLGFKSRQMMAIWTVLSAILLLGNIAFDVASMLEDERVEGASVVNPTVLHDAALLLGVEADALQQCLTMRTHFVRRDIVTTMLSPTGANAQRDSLMRDLYATLFAFVVETANHRTALNLEQEPGSTRSIVQLDVSGFQARQGSNLHSASTDTTLVSSLHTHMDFATNFVAEFVQSWVMQQVFQDEQALNGSLASDGVSLPEVLIGENSLCIELLRGSESVGEGSEVDRKPGGVLGVYSKLLRQIRSGDLREDDQTTMLERLDSLALHSSFVPSSAFDHRAFGVKHYQDTCAYSADGFLRQEQDTFDATFVQVLRQSQVPFISRLFSGPSLATEPHPRDPDVIADAQVSVRPLRRPASLSPGVDEIQQLLEAQKPYGITRQLNASISEILAAMQQAHTVWTVLALRPNDIDQPNAFDGRRVKSQVRAMLISDMIARKRQEYFTGMFFDAFCLRYETCGLVEAAFAAGVQEPREKIQAFAIACAWREALDFTFGHEKVWLSHAQWKMLEDRLRSIEPVEESEQTMMLARPLHERNTSQLTAGSSITFSPSMARSPSGEWDVLLEQSREDPFAGHRRMQQGQSPSEFHVASEWSAHDDMKGNDFGMSSAGVSQTDLIGKEGLLMESHPIGAVEEEPITAVRRWWVRFTWLFTWWIPTILLRKWGGMKRPDVQMAWREKVTICTLIFLLCATVLFYILLFGKLICPDSNRAWNTSQLGEHATEKSFFVAVRGKVYDITKFWKLQHSDSSSQATNDVMLQLAGLDLTPYFPIPLTVACPTLVTDVQLALQTNTSSFYYSPTISQAVHTSGTLGDQTSKLADTNWYPERFLPFMAKYYKGYFVTSKKALVEGAGDRQWAIIDKKIYDLGDYMWTVSLQSNVAAVRFLPSTVSDLFGSQAGQDISADYHLAMQGLNDTMRAATQNCMDNLFYAGLVDFRDTARCQVQNYLLLSFSILLVATIFAKFLAALQLTPKRNPEQQDKFVICQVPCYTENEEELRKTVDSLAALQYDDKRKLMFLICDGMIVGNGNEQPTPRILLDILGVDPKHDPEPKMFKSVAEGSKQLNFGKVYSGLYEFEGHVVPYIVVVKVGRPSERSRPGNRGKRDTQILLMRYLNRVHFDSPMYPLELEIYHHMKNVIGIDPAFYEYILMVDADTTVSPEGLNRLVAVAADDSRVIAVCGETKLFNEEGSWWTMIQVYEYYISHNLSKAFESLFGSVTCLPGCFSMYRIRSVDKGRPLLISNRVIDDYSEHRADTLHKKNLLSLGEDRYLTTLILKHFPTFSTKFSSDAKAQTTAPDRWGILLSQRRRWINSTVHNLAELILMPELCGFCFFSMRFIVFIDLLGTLILPATTIYLVYLVVVVSIGTSAIPYISLVMLGAVYGLQMIIFLLKRQWQYLGWLVIYLMAYPIWSFFLPIYSFWHMDDFSWGNTRIVVGEKGNKKIVAGTDEEPYDDNMLPLKRFSDHQRELLGAAGGVVGDVTDKSSHIDKHAPPRPSMTASGVFHTPQQSFHGSTYACSYAGSEYGANTSPGADYFQNTNVIQTPKSRRGSAMTLGQAQPEVDARMVASQSVMRGSINNFGPYSAFPTPVASMYGFPTAPMPSMYGMPMLHHAPSTPSIYGGPAASMMGYGAVPIAQPSSGSAVLQSAFSSMEPQQQQQHVAAQSTGGSWVGLAQPFTGSTAAGGVASSSSSRNPFGSEGDSSSAVETAAVLAVNPKPDPTDEDIASAVRTFLARQPDLMHVSKRDVREAIIAAFPNAPVLFVTKARVNRAVDETLASIA